MPYLGTQLVLKNSWRIHARNIAVLVIISLLTWYICLHIKVSLTNSLTKRVFWSVLDTNKEKAIKSGRYVIFDQFVPKPTAKVFTFVKRVGCSAGETLKVENDYYYCDGGYLGMAKRKFLSNMPLTPFVFNGRVPKGMFFVIGDHPDSFDSRYIGFISRDRIKEAAWALY